MENEVKVQRVKMSSIKSDDGKIVYFIKESIGGEDKIKPILEKIMMNLFKTSIKDGGDFYRNDGKD